jgi:hypothetical protein
METRQLFTDDEWTLVRDAPMNAGTGITALDAGIVSAAKEMVAVTKTLCTAAERYPNNDLIRVLVEDAGSDETSDQEEEEVPTVDQILAKVERAARLVEAKSPQDAPGFKQLVLEVADRAANASGSGILGFGEKVSDDEGRYLDRLRGLLQL